MCGICGRWSLRPPDPLPAVRRMCDAMTHRGPNDEGFLEDGDFAMGMRRLSVIDVAGGAQPIWNEDRTVAVVFNGEIYNHHALKEELEKKGHAFRTHADTEVIVHLYEEHGAGCFARLNGMFAIALWDARRRELHLARDRFGVKPLYYYQDSGRFVFASELAAIVRNNPDIRKDLDLEALDLYFSFYYFPTPWTAYAGIRSLPPGYRLTFQDGSAALGRYADYSFDVDPAIGLEEAVEEINRLIEAAVKRQLQSEVPVGLYLSSGLDSTAVLAHAARNYADLRTFTLGFAESSFNEADDAAMVAAMYGTKHHTFTMEASAVRDHWVDYIRHLGQPFGDWTDINGYLLSRAAKDHVTVVLCGAGGDEIFAGYPTILATHALSLYNNVPSFARSRLERIIENLPTSYRRLSFDYKLKSFVRGATEDPLRSHLKFKEIFSPEEKERLYARSFRRSLGRIAGVETPLAIYRDAVRDLDLTNAALYLDAHIFLVNSILESFDAYTALFSLEGRVPFLDNDLVDFLGRIRPEYKINVFGTKRIFRRALRKFLPEKILRLPKRGFNIPWGEWIRGPLRSFTEDLFAGDYLAAADLIDRKEARRYLDEHLAGKADHSRRIGCLSGYLIFARDQAGAL